MMSVPLSTQAGPAPGRRPPPSLLLAPHRPAFLGGMLMLILVSGWWALLLLAPQLGASVRTSMPPMMVHGFTFAAGFMPLFMTGFLFTAGPRWLDVPAPSARSLRWPVLMHLAGVGLLVVGSLVDSSITAFGALLLAMAWTAVGVGFAGLIRASRARDKLHAKWVMAFWAVGIGCALLFACGLGIRQPSVVAAALWLMVFGFITPIYATVAHRVLPFFTSNAVTRVVPWKPNWALGLLLTSLLVFGALQIAARLDLLPARQLATLTLYTVGPASLALAALALRWGLLQSLRGPSLRLLAMLHLGFVWSVLALLLASADAAVVLLGADATVRLGLAPLHALTMGFLGGLLFAMATRVICGHGGIPVVADGYVWLLFWVLQVAVVLRVAASVWPSHAAVLSASATLTWSAVWIAWAARYLPVLLRPRLDGRPG
ncbi:MAG TPA: NnrS family protein [Burkholderiaceae bacterium]|nr:NnrS family protein [Burkholderiaceae bacterium]